MKKILLPALLLVFSMAGARAQFFTVQVSGHVTELNTGMPVVNHPMTIFSDSTYPLNNFYWNIVYTDNNGYYSDNVPLNPAGTVVPINISTFDCNYTYQTVTVVTTGMPVVADFSICDGPPNQCSAYFIAYDTLNVPLTMHFLDLSTGMPTDWLWDFGDGTSSTLQNPIHTYGTPGMYQVCLTITNSNGGCTDTWCDWVSVDTLQPPPGCYTAFTYNVSMSNPLNYGFIDQSYPAPAAWWWDFGDGTTSQLQNPTHTFSAPGVYQVCLTTSLFPNCTSTACMPIFVDSSGTGGCYANFYYYRDSMNVMTCQFIDYSWGNPSNWLWDFGDGTSSTLQNPLHIFPAPGVYQVCLTISSPNTTCYSTYCDFVIVDTIGPGGCQADFYAYPYGQSLTMGFTDISYPYPASWLWDFGDGTTSTQQNPVHTFPYSGFFNVCLTIATGPATGCTSTLCMPVFVDSTGTGGCYADFIYYPDSMTNTIYFWDLSYFSPGTWSWSFGDGTGSNQQNPVHTYAAPGIYTVCLTITDSLNSCSDMICQQVYVDSAGGPSNQCQANFYGVPTGQLYTITFTDLSYPMPSSWMWDFGDNTLSSLPNPTHTYPGPGWYNVCLTITTNQFFPCTSTYCTYVLVDSNNPGGCFAYYNYFPDSSNMTVYFYDMSFPWPSSWSWSFGDGTASSLQNPVHTYAFPGLYTVCLTISDSAGMCTDTYCSQIQVDSTNLPNGCQANFSAIPDPSMMTYTFYDYSYPPPTSWYWSFGDGATSSQQNPVHTYAQTGSYNVCLVITNSGLGMTCSDTLCYYVIAGYSGFITGQVRTGNVPADQAAVYLIESDPAGGAYNIVDTTYATPAGWYTFYPVLLGNYYVMAELLPTSASYQQYLPTYHFNSLNWAFADLVHVSPNFLDSLVDIEMVPVVLNNPGPGSIAGSVVNGGSKLFGPGDPAPGVIILLYNQNNEPIGYIRSNQGGQFDFSSLSFGTYKVYAEVPGLSTVPAFVTLDASNPNAQNICFVIGPTGVTAGVGENNAGQQLSAGTVYPNPVRDRLSLPLRLLKPGTVALKVINQVGQTVVQKTFDLGTGTQVVELNTRDLPEGVYGLQVENANTAVTVRKFVKTN